MAKQLSAVKQQHSDTLIDDQNIEPWVASWATDFDQWLDTPDGQRYLQNITDELDSYHGNYSYDW